MLGRAETEPGSRKDQVARWPQQGRLRPKATPTIPPIMSNLPIPGNVGGVQYPGGPEGQPFPSPPNEDTKISGLAECYPKFSVKRAWRVMIQFYSPQHKNKHTWTYFVHRYFLRNRFQTPFQTSKHKNNEEKIWQDHFREYAILLYLHRKIVTFVT